MASVTSIHPAVAVSCQLALLSSICATVFWTAGLADTRLHQQGV